MGLERGRWDLREVKRGLGDVEGRGFGKVKGRGGVGRGKKSLGEWRWGLVEVEVGHREV